MICGVRHYFGGCWQVKYGHFIPLKHPFTAQSIVVLFIKEIVRLHGVPHSIISDRDKVFLSHFWSKLFKLQGTILKRNSAYHPQTDGQSDVVNRCIEAYLRCFVSDKPKQWVKWFPWVEYWYNTSYHTATQSTPFWLLYGRDPPPLVHYGHSSTTVWSIEHMLEEHNAVLEELKLNLHKAQDRMRATANRKRCEEHYDVGDLVYLKLQPYSQKSLAKRRNEKLSQRYYGPFPIEARVGTVAYQLTFPPSCISCLATSQGSRHCSYVSIITTTINCKNEVTRWTNSYIGTASNPYRIYLYYWSFGAMERSSRFDATWESFATIQNQFPKFHLVDKVAIWEGGNDRAPVYFTYARRTKNN